MEAVSDQIRQLVLSRAVGESILVDGPAEILVVDIRGVVRLMVRAKDATTVVRDELSELEIEDIEIGSLGEQG